MITQGHLAKFLLTLDPGKEPARMAFYHYLIHQGRLETPLQSQLISRFVEFALLHEHWQNHSSELQSELESSLQRFAETYRVRFDWKNIIWPMNNQVISIRDPRQTELLIRASLKGHTSEEDMPKFFRTRDGEVAVVTLREDGVKVQVYPNLARLHEGQLIPMVSQSLSYDRTLALTRGDLQVVQTEKHCYALFRVMERGCEGRLCRGYTLQSVLTFDGGDINRYPALFYPIKRLEQFFIHRKSDPMYVELVRALEKSVELLKEGHPEAQRFASASYERGKLAFHEIFPDDKLLGIALNSLEALLNSPRTSRPSEMVL
jgi:hypothetical protein